MWPHEKPREICWHKRTTASPLHPRVAIVTEGAASSILHQNQSESNHFRQEIVVKAVFRFKSLVQNREESKDSEVIDEESKAKQLSVSYCTLNVRNSVLKRARLWCWIWRLIYFCFALLSFLKLEKLQGAGNSKTQSPVVA